MAYQYPVGSPPFQADVASTCGISYLEQSDLTWTNALDTMQDSSDSFGFWGDVSWEAVDTELELQSPASATYGNQSPTTGSNNSMQSYDVGYAGSYTSQSSGRQLAPRTRQDSDDRSTTQESDDENKVKRRRIQNRNSQRAYRERARQKEERMSAVILRLQGEIDVLQMREKGATGMIEALTKEIERLKKKGLVLHYHPS